MRALLESIEAGHLVVRRDELAARLAPEELAAWERAGVLREEEPADGLPPTYELSTPDLVRLVRALFGVSARGLPVPARLEMQPVLIGWQGTGDDRREVVFVRWPHELVSVLARRRRTLAIVPTASSLTPAIRAAHGPTAFIAVDSLEDALVLRDGRLARASTLAPDAPAIPSPSPSPSPSHPPPLSPSPLLPLPRTARWNQVRLTLLDETTLRVDFAGRSLRVTPIDLGMAHSRTRKPTRVWELLASICEGYGTFRGGDFGGVDATKKLVSRLRQQLQAVFGLEQSAFHPYRRGDGWRARFQAERER